jgi:DNA polymerase-4
MLYGMTRRIFHVDLDEFIAAVEVLRNPELEGRPVVVGGDGDATKRGVVSTANYVARTYGVRSAMPLRTALKRCPDAVFLPVDSAAYLAASREVMDTLRSFDDAVVQVLGWDEAFMGIQASEPEQLARAVQARVLEVTRLWCSIGVGDSRHRAKLANGFAKPRGVFTLTRETWFELMGGMPTEALWGIGAKTGRKLAALGLRTVDQLAAADEVILADAFGPMTGPWLRQLATGDDDGSVTDVPHVPRGHGHERTFQHDLTEREAIERELSRLVRELMEDLRTDGRPVERVVVKVRFVPFVTRQHGVRLTSPTTDQVEIDRVAHLALAKFDYHRPIRLLGVRGEFAAKAEPAD